MGTMSQLVIAPRNPAIQTYVHQLDAAYRSGVWLPDQDYALRQDINVWEVIRRDPICFQAIEQRLHKVAAKDWIVAPARETPSPADVAVAKIAEEWISAIDGFGAFRYNLAKGIFRARAFAYPEGERRPATFGGVAGQWWCVDRIRDIDPRRIRYMPQATRQPDGSDKIEVFAEMWSLERHGWVRILPDDWQMFVRFVYDDDEAQLGHGRGVLNALYFYHYAKGIALREGLQGLERWAQGIVAAKVKSLRETSAGNDTAAQVAEWLAVIEKMRSRHALVHDAEDELTVHETSGSGGQMVVQILSYLDSAIVRAATGSLLPSGGGSSVGSNARAEVESDTSEDLVQFDRACLDEAITRDLLGQFWRLNRPQLVLAGYAAAGCPKLRSNTLKREDPEKSARVANTLLQARVKLRQSEVYEKTGYTMPQPGDPVFEGGSIPLGGGFNSLGGDPATSGPAAPPSGNPVLDTLRQRAAENSA